MIEIKHGHKAYGTQVIFEDISLRVLDPGIYGIVGKSGCGKSTLLNMIAGYEKLDQGELIVDSSLITIFQNYELIDELTIYDNIYLERNEDQYSKDMIDQLGLRGLLNQYPNELSGGQKQRVGIVRALIDQPLIICCDEPTESLDVTNKEVVMKLLKEYAKDHIVLLVTHQMDTVSDYADCIIEIKEHKLVIKKSYQNEMKIQKKIEYIPNIKQVKDLVRKIIKEKNRKFIYLFVGLLILLDLSVVLRQTLFYIPPTKETVNCDMLYIEADRDELLEQGIKEFEPIVQCQNSMLLKDKQALVNVYPFVFSDLNKKRLIDGSLPYKTYAVINNNVNDLIYDGDWKKQRIPMTLIASNDVLELDLIIVGVIEEKDTDGLNIYYDLDGINEFASNVITQDGLPFDTKFKSFTHLQQIEVGYDQIDSIKQELENKSITSKSPLYDERMRKAEESKLYRYMFNGFTCLITALLVLSIIILTNKEITYFVKDFAILASQSIPIDSIKKSYVITKVKAIGWVVVLNLIFLKGLSLKLTILQLTYLYLILTLVFVVYLMTILNSIKIVKQEKITILLKEFNEM